MIREMSRFFKPGLLILLTCNRVKQYYKPFLTNCLTICHYSIREGGGPFHIVQSTQVRTQSEHAVNAGNWYARPVTQN